MEVAIRDVIYDLDGNAFSGTVTIVPNGFPTSTPLGIISMPVEEGLLSVKLLPTTFAHAFYSVTFTAHSNLHQWTEKWAVPNSTVGLYLDEIRIESPILRNGKYSSRSLSLPLPMSDIANLNASLSQINASLADLNNRILQVTSSVQSLTSVTRVIGEAPGGTIDGTNVNFTLRNTPASPVTVSVIRNGMTLRLGGDFSVSGNIITFLPGCVPNPGDTLAADYTAAAANQQGSGQRGGDTFRDITLPIPISGVTGLSAVLSQINGSVSGMTTTITGLQSTIQSLEAFTQIYGETPSGLINGINTSFVLSHSPIASKIAVFKNGLRQMGGVDYILSGQTFTFSAIAIPHTGDILLADYDTNTSPN